MFNPQLQQHLELYDDRFEYRPSDDTDGGGAASEEHKKSASTALLDIYNSIWSSTSAVTAALAALIISRSVEGQSSSPVLWILLPMSFVVLWLEASRQSGDKNKATLGTANCAKVSETRFNDIKSPVYSHSTGEEVHGSISLSQSQLSDLRCSVLSELGSIGAPLLVTTKASSCGSLRPPFDLTLLQNLTGEHVELIRLVDSSAEWIRNAYRVRFGLSGRSSFDADNQTWTATFSPSVERLEQATVSRLLKCGRATLALPLSTLRRNLSTVLLQQELALLQCLGDNNGDEERLSDSPPIVTIAWLRRQRNINASLLSKLVDALFDSIVECNGTPVNEINHAYTTVSLISATTIARELQAYVLASVPASVGERSSHRHRDRSKGFPQHEVRMQKLRQQALAVTAACLCFHESMGCSDDEPNERDFWWDKILELASSLSREVVELDALVNPSRGATTTALPDAEGENTGSVTEPLTRDEPEEEFVVVQFDKKCPNVEQSRPSHETKTLVYTGKGGIARRCSSLFQAKTKSCSSDSASLLVPPLDSGVQLSLLQELQGRLALMEADEVDAHSLSDQSETSDRRRDRNIPDIGEPMPAPLFLDDLQRAVQSTFPSSLTFGDIEL